MSTKITYVNKNLLISPRKLRLTVNAVKSLKPSKAIELLKLTNNLPSRLLVKCIKNVINNAKVNHNLDPATLKFTEFTSNEGMKLKRMDKSHGSRFNRGIIIKRHARVTITVEGQPFATSKVTPPAKVNSLSKKTLSVKTAKK